MLHPPWFHEFRDESSRSKEYEKPFSDLLDEERETTEREPVSEEEPDT